VAELVALARGLLLRETTLSDFDIVWLGLMLTVTRERLVENRFSVTDLVSWACVLVFIWKYQD
jgi:hypothetical protein